MRKLLQRLAAVALPERCPACTGPSTQGFCAGCQAELPRIEHACRICGLPSPVRHCPRQRGGWHVVAVRAPFRYAPPLDAYLHKLKFGRVRALGRALALAAAPSLAAGVDAPRESDPLLVPVPLSRERLLERGFDQAVEIARALARELALPADTAVAMRRKPIAPQSLLGARDRRANVAGLFAVTKPSAVVGRAVIVVDDVITTGATVNALAAVLLTAGAIRVEAWAIARTIA